jgi:hypothetical protein
MKLPLIKIGNWFYKCYEKNTIKKYWCLCINDPLDWFYTDSLFMYDIIGYIIEE